MWNILLLNAHSLHTVSTRDVLIPSINSERKHGGRQIPYLPVLIPAQHRMDF